MNLPITLDDSIPQQAGPGAGADEQTLAAAIAAAAQKAGIYNGEVPLTGPHLLQLLEDLAAPLAVEDSRERCASSDARMLTGMELSMLDGNLALDEYRRRHNDFIAKRAIEKFCEVNGIRLAAMAAASSGKEKME